MPYLALRFEMKWYFTGYEKTTRHIYWRYWTRAPGRASMLLPGENVRLMRYVDHEIKHVTC